ncbi:hypothetical protein AB4Z52_23445 [Rhizobium sp. 2YAF20]|uniref:hypothetical protein n=1 Tax=Rhizobium sp. 2YAF20 TaxID=3233027 RepID=UPI003F9A82FD
MHAEKFSEIIAHFIGLFDPQSEEARLRQLNLEGQALRDGLPHVGDLSEQQAAFQSNLNLQDYDPHLKYDAAHESYDHLQARLYDQTYQQSLKMLQDLANIDLPHMLPSSPLIALDEPERLHTDKGADSNAFHLLQANAVRDDDVLDMTNGVHPVQNLAYINEQLGEMSAKAESMSPFSHWVRTDSYDGVVKIAGEVHDYAQKVEQSGGANLQDPDGSHYFVTASNNLDGIYINGVVSSSVPVLDDYLPNRGLAAAYHEPVGSDGAQHLQGAGPNSLDIETGANVVANLAGIVDTNMITPLMAVMGDYHSINSISQTYIYSNSDKVDGLSGDGTNSVTNAPTIGKNIAIFAHDQFNPGPAAQSGADSHTMPDAWHVSVVNGDVSFVHWMEQYNFLSDNDTMTVQTSGVETSVLSGGNTVTDLASYLGIGTQYDLVIVGGQAYNMNSINQISVLYDNDTVKLDGNGTSVQVQTGNNLMWNLASIENVGSPNRFAAMPDYMNETMKNIQDHQNAMPGGLAADPNFAGYPGLNVLYITGNFYDVNVIKQVNIVGDADSVTKVANSILQDNANATVHIDTGSNAVINVASIVDYDSFGHTTYVAGNVYSDAVLIQGGLLDHGQTNTAQPGQLANEAIAFLGNNDPVTSTDDHHTTTIDAGHDLSFHNGSVGDVMQSVTA